MIAVFAVIPVVVAADSVASSTAPSLETAAIVADGSVAIVTTTVVPDRWSEHVPPSIDALLAAGSVTSSTESVLTIVTAGSVASSTEPVLTIVADGSVASVTVPVLVDDGMSINSLKKKLTKCKENCKVLREIIYKLDMFNKHNNSGTFMSTKVSGISYGANDRVKAINDLHKAEIAENAVVVAIDAAIDAAVKVEKQFATNAAATDLKKEEIQNAKIIRVYAEDTSPFTLVHNTSGGVPKQLSVVPLQNQLSTPPLCAFVPPIMPTSGRTTPAVPHQCVSSGASSEIPNPIQKVNSFASVMYTLHEKLLLSSFLISGNEYVSQHYESFVGDAKNKYRRELEILKSSIQFKNDWRPKKAFIKLRDNNAGPSESGWVNLFSLTLLRKGDDLWWVFTAFTTGNGNILTILINPENGLLYIPTDTSLYTSVVLGVKGVMWSPTCVDDVVKILSSSQYFYKSTYRPCKAVQNIATTTSTATTTTTTTTELQDSHGLNTNSTAEYPHMNASTFTRGSTGCVEKNARKHNSWTTHVTQEPPIMNTATATAAAIPVGGKKIIIDVVALVTQQKMDRKLRDEADIKARKLRDEADIKAHYDALISNLEVEVDRQRQEIIDNFIKTRKELENNMLLAISALKDTSSTD